MLRHILPLVVAFCPSISQASDNNLCKPRIQEECFVQHPNDSFCNQLKRFCERQSSARVVRHPPLPMPTVPAVKAPVPAPSFAIGAPDYPPPQSFFIRADKLDNPYPGLSRAVTAGQALGASVSYTGNDFVQTKSGSTITVSNSQSVVISGLASYAYLDPSTGYGWVLGETAGQDVFFAPSLWVYGNGNWDEPMKSFGDTSALKIGPEVDFLFAPHGIQKLGETFENYVGLAPFYQTDFYGRAQAEGGTLSWTPSYPNLFLNAERPGFGEATGGLVDGFIELRAETTYLDVTQPGQTNLHQGSYEWLGGAARTYVFFFPSEGGANLPPNIAPYVVDRLSFVGTFQDYWDANSKATAYLFSAALNYKLVCDSTGKMTSSNGSKVNCTGGSPSLSVEYDQGTDRDTLQYEKKILVKMNYAF